MKILGGGVGQQRVPVIRVDILPRCRCPGSNRFIDERNRRNFRKLGLPKNTAIDAQIYGIIISKQFGSITRFIYIMLSASNGKNTVAHGGFILSRDINHRSGRLPKHTMLDHWKDRIRGPGPVFHQNALIGVEGQAVFHPHLTAAAQTERHIAYADCDPFRGGIVAVVEKHRAADSVGYGDVPQAQADGIIRLNANGIGRPVQHGSAPEGIGTALEDHRRHVQVAGGVRLGNAPWVQSLIGAGVDVDHVAAFQVIAFQQLVQIRHRGIGGQAGISVAAVGRAVDVVAGGRVVDIVEHGRVADGEQFFALHAASRGRFELELGPDGRRTQGGVPVPKSGQRRLVGGQYCPGPAPVGGIRNRHHAVGGRAPGVPPDGDVRARGPAAIVEAQQCQGAVCGRLGCLGGIGIAANVDPAAVVCRFGAGQSGIPGVDEPGIAAGGVQHIVGDGRVKASGRTDKMEIAANRVHHAGLVGKTVGILAGIEVPGLNGIEFAAKVAVVQQGRQPPVHEIEVVVVGI